MNILNKIKDSIRNFTLWRVLKFIAVLSLISVIYSISIEANTLNKAFNWITDKLLKITWEKPVSGSDHYRVEITKTNLLSEPLKTDVSYIYTKDNNYQIELIEDHSYLFRIQGINSYGTSSDFSDSSSLLIYKGGEYAAKVADDAPQEFSLSQNYPNPFNNRTTIDYYIPNSVSSEKVNLTIYNILGQRVKEIVNENQQPGKHSVFWDGHDQDGRLVSSGHYIYLFNAGNYTMSKKMIFMK